MQSPRVLILTGYGINCDLETEYAFQTAGALTQRLHINHLKENPNTLMDYQILALAGGFSFGDHIGSGKVFAVKMKAILEEQLQRFIGKDNLIIGICNGFQTLVKLGILPNLTGDWKQLVSLTHNDSGKFEDRWVYLDHPPDNQCVWTKDCQKMYLPIRHGEGKFLCLDQAVLDEIENNHLVAFRYTTNTGLSPSYPDNPNGSVNHIAGISDRTGRILGMMPHPEAFIHKTLHPQWTREDVNEKGDGLKIFENAVAFFS